MVAGVAATIGSDLQVPSLRQLHAPCGEPPAMPEIAVNKDCDTQIAEHEVRSTRQVGSVTFAVEAGPAEELRHDSFGTCVPAFDPGHQRAPLGRTHDVATVP